MLLFFKDKRLDFIMSESLLTSIHFLDRGVQYFKERSLTFILSTHKVMVDNIKVDKFLILYITAQVYG